MNRYSDMKGVRQRRDINKKLKVKPALARTEHSDNFFSNENLIGSHRFDLYSNIMPPSKS